MSGFPPPDARATRARRHPQPAVRLASAVLCCLLTAACGGSPPPTVATLPIEGAPQPIAGASPQQITLAPMHARVAAGSQFAVVADTTDGPLIWKLTSPGLPAIVKKEGSAPVGSCGNPPKVGCALPVRYSFLASARGTTTMLWTEYTLCPSQPTRFCPGLIQPIQLTVS